MPKSSRFSWSFPARRAAILALPLLTGGCLGSYHEPVRTVSSTDQAAAVLITPTMVAPWKSISDALAPNFTLTGDTALTQVIPVTERVQDQVLRALGVGLALGLPTSSKTSSTSFTNTSDNKSATDATGVTTSTATTDNSKTDSGSTSKAAGTAPTLPSGTPPGASLPAGLANSGDVGISPIDKFKAAGDLLAAVVALNNEMQNAAQRTCYEPYLLKLKMAVMPYRPNLGYDLHTRISFSDTQAAEHLQPIAPADLAKMTKVEIANAKAAQLDPCTGEGHVPVVVPLLAADDLQMATRAKAAQEAQQLAFAINLMVHGVGANASANKINQTMHAILNNEVSSSLTVSREIDNTLYVRVAAANVASGEPALVGQTYDILVLLLVPHGYFAGGQKTTIGINSFTEFRDAMKGDILGGRLTPALLARAGPLAEPFLSKVGRADWKQLDEQSKLGVLQTIAGSIQSGDYGDYLDRLATIGTTHPDPDYPNDKTLAKVVPYFDPTYAPIMWTSLGALTSDSAFKTTLVELPMPAEIVTSPQDAFVMDDGKDTATAVLNGVSGYSAGALRPTLRVVPLDKKKKPQSIVIVPVQSASFDAGSQALTLTFPSLTKLGLTDLANDGNVIDLALSPCDPLRHLCSSFGKGKPSVSYVAHVVKTTPDSAKAAAFLMTSASPIVVIQKDSEGVGHAAIVVKKLPATETATIAISGADVQTANDSKGGPLTLTADGYAIATNGTYTFGFHNLSRDDAISFTGTELKKGVKVGTTPLTLHAK